MIDLARALISLYPNISWNLNGNEYSGLQWNSNVVPKPSEAELEAEDARLQVMYDTKQYQRDRAFEYPPITDLADAMYWVSKGDNTKLDAYYAKCEAVKQKYPKAE